MKLVLNILFIILAIQAQAQAELLPESAANFNLGMSFSELKQSTDLNGRSIKSYGRNDQAIVISPGDKMFEEISLVFRGMKDQKALGRDPWRIGDGGRLSVADLGDSGELIMISFSFKNAKKAEKYLIKEYGEPSSSHKSNSPMSGPNYDGLWQKTLGGKTYYIGANYTGGWFQISNEALVK